MEEAQGNGLVEAAASVNDTMGEDVGEDEEVKSTMIAKFWLRFALEGVVVAVVANCGIFGNVVSAFILLRRRLDLQPFLCRLLVLLVVCDTVFLAGNFLTYSLPMLSGTYADRLNPLLAPKLLIPLTQVALTGSVYTTVAVTVERYVSCCWPLVPQREGVKTSAAAVAAIAVFSFVFNVTRFFEFNTARRKVELYGNLTIDDLPEDVQADVRELQESQPLEIAMTPMRNDPHYIRYYIMTANWTVMVFLPLTSLIILNWKIHKAIKNREQFRATLTQPPAATTSTSLSGAAVNQLRRPSAVLKATKEREVTIGQVLVIIVITFVVCQSFKVIVVGYEAICHFNQPDGKRLGGYPLWVEVVISLNHVALAFNAAINIVIYICKDKTFRKEGIASWATRLCRCFHVRSSASGERGSLRLTRLRQNTNGHRQSRTPPPPAHPHLTPGGRDIAAHARISPPPKIQVTLAGTDEEQTVQLVSDNSPTSENSHGGNRGAVVAVVKQSVKGACEV